LTLNVALAQKCLVESTNYLEVCENGESCTPMGCRCLQNSSCFHSFQELGLAYRLCQLPEGSQYCRSGESCVKDVGCRCVSDCLPPTCTGFCNSHDPDALMPHTMNLKNANRLDCFMSGKCASLAATSTVGQQISCVDGFAGEYPCLNVDLLSFSNFTTLGSNATNTNGNDIWGWSNSGRDFAIVCLTHGTSFVEITDPLNPLTIGFLPTTSTPSTWRDAKVYKDYAFIVSEASNHGMQIFDLKRLLTETKPGPGNQYTADLVDYTNMGNASQRSTHNIAINEDTGFAYLVGCKTCRGGLLMVDINNPMNPQPAGCFADDGYTHDTQCVVYSGPDERFHGQEICFGLNEDSLTIVDVTTKSNPVMLSRVPYYGVRYTHQGWLTENQKYLLVDDELDEMYNTYDDTKKTVTYIFDVSNLGEPMQIKILQSPVPSIDHNQYIEGNYTFQSNYASGLRIWNGMLGELEEATWKSTLIGYFDVHPTEDVAQFYGSWSVYPFYSSQRNVNTIVVNSIEKGLFVLHFDKKAHLSEYATSN